MEFVESGALYSVYQLVDDAGVWAVKVPERRPRAADRFTACAVLGGISTAWNLHTTTGAAEDPPDLVALLEAEAVRIRSTDGAWNHEVRCVGSFDFYDGPRTGLCTRWFDGTPLAKLDRARARELFPQMLPSLWEALSIALHGDLHAGNLIIGENKFAIIDPGAIVVSSRGPSGPTSGAHSLTCITHASGYPILPPFCPPTVPGTRLPDAWRGWVASHTMDRQYTNRVAVDNHVMQAFDHAPDALAIPVPRGRPLPADLLALGILYYQLLTDRHPFPLAVERGPAWSGLDVLDNHVTGNLLGEAAIAAPPVRPSMFTAGITRAEDERAMALLDLTYDLG